MRPLTNSKPGSAMKASGYLVEFRLSFSVRRRRTVSRETLSCSVISHVLGDIPAVLHAPVVRS